MPGVFVDPPVRESYQFVLRRYDKSWRQPWTESIYIESVSARGCDLDGVRAPTLFVTSKHLRDRCTKLGWIDETDRWLAWLDKVSAPPEEAPARRRKRVGPSIKR
jgi:hypothetical protein